MKHLTHFLPVFLGFSFFIAPVAQAAGLCQYPDTGGTRTTCNGRKCYVECRTPQGHYYRVYFDR